MFVINHFLLSDGLMLVELAAACTGVRWTVSQLVMQREVSEQGLNIFEYDSRIMK